MEWKSLGRAISYPNELPCGMVNPISADEPFIKLPAWAPSGWQITNYVESDGANRGGVDPVVIHDRWGNIVHQWEDGYLPSYAEIANVMLKQRNDTL